MEMSNQSDKMWLIKDAIETQEPRHEQTQEAAVQML